VSPGAASPVICNKLKAEQQYDERYELSQYLSCVRKQRSAAVFTLLLQQQCDTMTNGRTNAARMSSEQADADSPINRAVFTHESPLIHLLFGAHSPFTRPPRMDSDRR
jgi:hypothetical protein